MGLYHQTTSLFFLELTYILMKFWLLLTCNHQNLIVLKRKYEEQEYQSHRTNLSRTTAFVSLMMKYLKTLSNSTTQRRIGENAQKGLNLGLVIISAFIIWRSLMLITYTESPIVVVLSGSMEPAYYRGDILFLTNYEKEPIVPGDVVVFNLEDKEIPIVHRVTVAQETEDSEYYILTKGDNNDVDDRDGRIYNPGQLWVRRKDISGKVRGYLPYVGYTTILLNAHPAVKMIILALLGLSTLLAKDPQD